METPNFQAAKEQLLEGLNDLNDALTEAIVRWLNKPLKKLIDEEIERYLQDKGLTEEALKELQSEVKKFAKELKGATKILEHHEETIYRLSLGINQFADDMAEAKERLGRVERVIIIWQLFVEVQRAFVRTEKLYSRLQAA